MKKLFGTDGIRGIAGEFPLVPEFVKKIGYVSTKVLLEKSRAKTEKTILVGRDTRISGEEIFSALTEGINTAGAKVIDLDIFPTPGVAYLTRKRKILAGIVISASHNSWEFNGIKFFSSQGLKLPDEIEEEIEKRLQITDYRLQIIDKSKTIKDKRTKREYLTFLRKTLPKNFNLRGKRIVIDCANGATCEFVTDIFSQLKAGVIFLNTQPNGKNINLQCGSLHLEQLCKTVKDTHSDLGFAFDGDGDRVLFTDEQGNAIDGDQLMCLLAEEWKNKGELKSNLLVVTRMSNFGLYQLMREKGIKVHTVAVGDRYVWEGMQEKKAVLGGEQSGHIIFKSRPFGITTGDGLITALQILKIYQESLSGQEGLPFSQLFRMIKYPQVLLNIPLAGQAVKMRKDLNTLPKVKEAIKDGEEELNTQGRIFVRYSGTEPLLRILVEGKDKKQIQQIAKKIAQVAQNELS